MFVLEDDGCLHVIVLHQHTDARTGNTSLHLEAEHLPGMSLSKLAWRQGQKSSSMYIKPALNLAIL
jgi:hypothetical protein